MMTDGPEDVTVHSVGSQNVLMSLRKHQRWECCSTEFASVSLMSGTSLEIMLQIGSTSVVLWNGKSSSAWKMAN